MIASPEQLRDLGTKTNVRLLMNRMEELGDPPAAGAPPSPSRAAPRA